MGYDVTVFEAFHHAGGVLTYGIPEVPPAQRPSWPGRCPTWRRWGWTSS